VSSVNGNLSRLDRKAQDDPEIHELVLERAVKSRLTGGVAKNQDSFFSMAERSGDRIWSSQPNGARRLASQPCRPCNIFFESKNIGIQATLRFQYVPGLVRVMTKVRPKRFRNA